jgi:hypothetical protein
MQDLHKLIQQNKMVKVISVKKRMGGEKINSASHSFLFFNNN